MRTTSILSTLVAIAATVMAAAPLAASSPAEEWERDWQWHYPDGKPRRARNPVNRVHHPLALTSLDAQRDLADVVLERTGALLEDLSAMPNVPDLTRQRAAWKSLAEEAERIARSALPARKALYLRACALRRQIALANPLLNFQEILFVKTVMPQLSMYAWHGPCTAATSPHSGIFAVSNWQGAEARLRDLVAGKRVANGRMAGQTIAGRGCFADPDLDWDGKRILFAWNEQGRPFYYYREFKTEQAATVENARHIFKTEDRDGAELSQLTHGVQPHYAPCWLPSGRIAFIAHREPGINRCRFGSIGPVLDEWFDAGYLPYAVPRIYSMAADGSDIRRHSPHDAAEWTPSVDNAGRLIYGRWDYIDRGIPLQSFWTQYPDGRDPRSPHGNYPEVTKQHRGCAPTVGATYMRAVPGTHGKYVYITSNHRIYEWGALLWLDLDRPDEGNGNQLEEITPDLDYPTSGHDGGLGSDGPVYSTPWPLNERYFLVAFRREMPPLPPSTRTRELPYEQRPKFGLYLLDIFGNRELIYCDPHVDCVKPIPLAARPRPPVVPDMVRDAKDAGPARPATIGVMNVYASDLAWPSDVNISALRIIQLFQNYGGGDEPPMGYTGMALPRIPLGTVPVYEDGSAYFEAPVNRMIYFQALDENGLAVQSMRSATVVHSGETLTCVGCHEAKWKTPTLRNREPPLAFRRGRPDKITPEVCGTEPFTFARHVQPVLAAKCADCHVKEGKGPQNLANTTLTVFKGGRNKNGLASASFAELRPYTWFYALNYSVKDNRSVPGQIGARAAKLLKCLSPEHHGVKLTPQERRLITLWMDLGSPYYCSIFDRGKQHAGELVYPRFDFDPDNFFGLDRPSSPFPTNLSLD